MVFNCVNPHWKRNKDNRNSGKEREAKAKNGNGAAHTGNFWRSWFQRHSGSLKSVANLKSCLLEF